MDGPDLTSAFLGDQIDPAAFDDAAHVRVAYDLLGQYDFLKAATLYADGIQSLAKRAGAADKFNLTITCAFLSLIAERRDLGEDQDFSAFVLANPDLMSKSALQGHYTSARISSERARRIFLLPDGPALSSRSEQPSCP